MKAALLIIDVQRDFCAPDGAVTAFGADLSTIDGTVDRIDRLIGAARRAGVDVIFVRLETEPELDSPAMLRWYERQGIDPLVAAAVCRKGEPGADYYRLFPEPGDTVVSKTRYSGFVGTNLDEVLQEKEIGIVYATGVTTECCVESTVRDAFMRDYEAFVVSDACTAYEEELHLYSLRAMALNFATLIDTETLLAEWADIGEV
ncbi:cysteine hydrolase family protein [Paenibacillus sp. NPDC056722]|uniref:cysteine hydrolase family protein n=1 Tax=Paenibacillus sp. NPDC056722 TaxID=3345924 RepID=UPI00369A07E9